MMRNLGLASSNFSFSRKAYLQIDLLFAVLIFIIFLFVSYQYVSDKFDNFEFVNEVNMMQADARDLCFLLTKTAGAPNYWNLVVPNMIYPGIRDGENYNLSLNKMNAFTDGNYMDIVNSLNIGGFIYINVSGINSDTNYLEFGEKVQFPEFVGSYVCYGQYTEPVRVYVEVWK